MATAQPEPYQEAYRWMLQAAAPLGKLTTGYDAEVATSVLLGAVYAQCVPSGRRETVADFVDGFVKFLGRRRTGDSLAVLAGLAAVAPGMAGERAARTVGRWTDRGLTGPPWIDQVGKVRCTGGWQVRDAYGDQTHYLATYTYDSPLAGGPEHAVGVLVDHNRRLVTDLLVHYSAEETLADWRRAVETTSGHVTVEPVESALIRSGAEPPLRRTEELPEPPGGQRYLNNWAFTLARLALLPDSGQPASSPVDTGAVVRDFLESSDARRVTREMSPSVADAAEVVRHGAQLVATYAAETTVGNPLRWSPTAVTDLLLEWMPAQRDLPPDVVTWLPEVLDAFVMYAADLRELSEPAMLATRMAIARSTSEYQTRTLGDPGGESMATVLDR
ncbi:MAG TPA: hypothetical protein VHJ83_11815, partial [Micromonosporaceae bacterium]|nr:hypothetical protein [Micromonosporaceae bacterium]